MTKDRMPIYFDNAATSFPKAPGVAKRMASYVSGVGANVNRASYKPAAEAGRVLLETRELLCRLFNFPYPEHVIFTGGMTPALNQVLKGLFFKEAAGHVLVGATEHNAVMRPLCQLASLGVTYSRMEQDENGVTEVSSAKRLIRPDTKMVLAAHASNVSGGVTDIAALGRLCNAAGVPLALDAAQTAGHYDIDFQALGLSALCIPGHKGMLGPQGVGALLLLPEFAKKLEPLIAGGTGSASDSEQQPEYMPDRFESGTLNLPGIYGLNAAAAFIEKTGVRALQAREQEFTHLLVQGFLQLPVSVFHSPGMVGVVSVDFSPAGLDNAIVSDRLEREYGILTRCGLHCAPAAHRALGTFPQGTVRFSLGYSTTKRDIARVICAVSDIVRK